MGLCFHKCFEVCKTLSHPFLPLNLRAVQQINQGDKITEPPSTGTGPPPHFPGMSQGVRNGGSGSPNSHSIAVSPMPVSFHNKHVLSSKTSKTEIFFPYFSGRHGLFLPAQQLFFSLGSYLFSIFAGTDVTVIERWALSLPTWARTSLATQRILIW